MVEKPTKLGMKMKRACGKLQPNAPLTSVGHLVVLAV